LTEKFESRAVVSGIGISDIGRRLPRRQLDLALDASLLAIEDAGLTVGDIDGLAMMSYGDTAGVAEALGLELAWSGGAGAGAQLGPVINAAMAVAAGLCDHVLVYRSVNMLPGVLPTGAGGKPEGEWQWQIPFHDYAAPINFALYAQRHMHRYGTTKEQLGWVALTCRDHAIMNDLAAMRTPLTMDDYLAARMISTPLGLLDCDLPIDGATALVVSRADYAPDAPQPPVRFEAVGCARYSRPSWDQYDDFPAMTIKDAGDQMWARTDLTPADVDVAELYDGFTFITLAWLEALSFCAAGESGPFVEGGERVGLGGELPLNTYGGQLSAGRLHGFWLLHEAILQLRGHAGARQVDGAEVAVAAAGAGVGGGTILFTR
jgi:acetyl-CoA acetyltransferase